MNGPPSIRSASSDCSRESGSILIYVMWILVLISGLALQLTSASRVVTLNQSAGAKQLKTQMQIESAIQFAQYNIMIGSWQDRSFDFFLNEQKLSIEVINESGFISIYDLQDKDLKNAFNRVDLGPETVDALAAAFGEDEDQVRFNSFDELLRLDGIDVHHLARLVPVISIYHQDAINPQHSPAEVLMLLDGVDQYRVRKLMEAVDHEERWQLRNELVDIISRREDELSQDDSDYYRIRITLDGDRYRVILRADRRLKGFKTLLVEPVL